MIHVRQISKRYADANGEFVAVDQVSFDVLAGQIYGLLGPNGAGKTTILRILATVLRPTSGTASVNGWDILTHPEQVRGNLGFVSNSTAIYDRMTGWEMVDYFGRLCGLASDLLRDRMELLFDRFKMNDIRDVLGCNMSTGMRQKVSIARALVHDPPVLIFDEATSGLDIIAARDVIQTVARLRDAGKCILFSTHIMSEIQRLCDRVAILHGGRVVAEGDLAELGQRFGQPDLDELFYQLIANGGRRGAASPDVSPGTPSA
jgi:sodium transport system ATP-binding protein